MNKLFIGLFIFSATASASIDLTPKGGQVSMLAQGNNFIKIQGTGAAPTGKVTVDGKNIRGELQFDLASLDTKNETRN